MDLASAKPRQHQADHRQIDHRLACPGKWESNALHSRLGTVSRCAPFARHVFAVLPFPVFGGNGCNLMMLWSAANSGSFCTSTASHRLAVAATKASANEILCAAFSCAASLHYFLSDWCHTTGLSSTVSSSSRARSAPNFYVVMYSNSVSVTKEAWSAASPSNASSKYASTSSAPASSCDQVSQAEVSSRTLLLTNALLRPVGQQGGQQSAAGKHAPPASYGRFLCRPPLITQGRGLLQLPQHFTLLLRWLRLA